MMMPAVAALLGAAALAGCAYLVVALVAVLTWPARPDAAPPPPATALTLLKPLCGADPGLFERLRRFCRQAYPAPVQIVFGVQDAGDPAIAVVERLRAEEPDADIALVVDRRMHGTNRKVSNLVNMMRAARHDVLVLSDADMVVGEDYLRGVAAGLARPGVGAVTCLYTGIAGRGVWSALAAQGVTAHFLPSVLVGLRTGLAQPCMGSTIALRRRTLDAIGGFSAFADRLADDYALGAAVRAAGLSVAVAPGAIGHVFAEASAGAVLRNELRWARTIRVLDPAGAAGAVVVHPFPLALLGALAGSSICGAIALAALGLRAALCRAAERRFETAPSALWLLPVRELLSFGVFVASFFGRGVTWADLRYRVSSDGRLTPAETRGDPR